MTDRHGTLSGYARHKTRNDTPCRACLKAWAAYNLRRNFIRGLRRDPSRCRCCGSVFLGHQCVLALIDGGSDG